MLLGVTDLRAMMRTGEVRYAELDLATAGTEELLAAMVANPVLIERPIAMRGDRAVIARPPEQLLELLEPPARPAGLDDSGQGEGEVAVGICPPVVE